MILSFIHNFWHGYLFACDATMMVLNNECTYMLHTYTRAVTRRSNPSLALLETHLVLIHKYHVNPSHICQTVLHPLLHKCRMFYRWRSELVLVLTSLCQIWKNHYFFSLGISILNVTVLDWRVNWWQPLLFGNYYFWQFIAFVWNTLDFVPSGCENWAL